MAALLRLPGARNPIQAQLNDSVGVSTVSAVRMRKVSAITDNFVNASGVPDPP